MKYGVIMTLYFLKKRAGLQAQKNTYFFISAEILYVTIVPKTSILYFE